MHLQSAYVHSSRQGAEFVRDSQKLLLKKAIGLEWTSCKARHVLFIAAVAHLLHGPHLWVLRISQAIL